MILAIDISVLDYGVKMTTINVTKNITDVIGHVGDVAVSLIWLSIVLEVVFGSAVPFLSLGVIGNISAIISDLGSQGLIGLITLGILWSLWKSKA